jgi:adenine C2-methylase RlmN of 23S rRNA A2503 and tRNA A37
MPEDYSIVEKDENWDGDVIKYIHNNGNETTVKVGQSCTGGNTDTSVLFLSTSIGCPQNCKFCWLTSKKYPYKRISKETIIYSAFEALDASIDKIKGTYLKLSFMGMGDFCAEDYL